ncbi:hypothetical protein LWI28_019800 [Acer negundo]|uniref:Uncharacterized protein n=1 Tax=Acer negundo TaxID=4023 RepID=A0AAD5NM40_ACENE|nr:hypothetical protein LWI28_019800 [Acer negundo]
MPWRGGMQNNTVYSRRRKTCSLHPRIPLYYVVFSDFFAFLPKRIHYRRALFSDSVISHRFHLALLRSRQSAPIVYHPIRFPPRRCHPLHAAVLHLRCPGAEFG